MNLFKKCLSLLLLLSPALVYAQDTINYDESKVLPYKLPELMKCNDGREVKTVEEWEQIRRPELIELFRDQIYGRNPQEKINVSYQIASDKMVFGGKARRQEIKFIFAKANQKHEAVLLLFLPTNAKKPVPVFMGYNFSGNQTVSADTTIAFSPSLSLIKKKDDPNIQRGVQAKRWPAEMIIDNGFALATMCYHDVYPDVAGFKNVSIMSLFSDYDTYKDKPDAWQAIGVWAWGLSRIADYLITRPEINPEQIAVMGHSRNGKVALWAGALDKRFAIVISNESGEGGAALSHRNYGENIWHVSTLGPGWFCYNYNKYRADAQLLPVDSHELIALIAPRPVYVASAVEDRWSDPYGEYLGAYYASPAYKLYGLKGLTTDKQPALNHPVMTRVGYHIRDGKHDVTNFDWQSYITFAKMYFH
jgi:hypothetical protein